MRILLASNGNWCGTGYGTQSKGLSRALRDLGHTVALAPTYGLYGGRLVYDNMMVYPPAPGDMLGVESLPEHALDFKADLVITLYDIWPFATDFGHNLNAPWLAWFPVDSIPVAPRLTQVAASARYPTVYSKFGLEQMRSVGLDCHYVPHAVDTTVFKPGDKQAAREVIKIPQDKFVVLMVAMNKGIPARKAFPEQIAAFAEFHKSHPGSALYLHTNFTGPEALPIEPILWEVGLHDGCIYTTPPYKIKTGLSEPDLALLYQACDVLMNASYGEGFGLTILEAQACGIPVITNNVTSMPEITFYGQTVEPAQKQWNPLGCWWYPPSIPTLTEALEKQYGVIRELPDVYAIPPSVIEREYAWPAVRDKHWAPLLEYIENDLKARPKPTEVLKMCRIRGIDLIMADWPGSLTVQCVESELIADGYGIEFIPFKPGDTVVDIGANVGVVSCYMGKRWPELRIIAVEPEPRNYQHLVENLARNKITNVTALNVGITGDGRDITLATPDFNSGGATIYNSKPNGDFISTAKSMTLEALFDEFEIAHCKFLKCDCEGAEYEVLGGSPVLDRIEYLGAEFHVNGMTDAAGYSPQALVDELSQHIAHLKFQAIRIP